MFDVERTGTKVKRCQCVAVLNKRKYLGLTFTLTTFHKSELKISTAASYLISL